MLPPRCPSAQRHHLVQFSLKDLPSSLPHVILSMIYYMSILTWHFYKWKHSCPQILIPVVGRLPCLGRDQRKESPVIQPFAGASDSSGDQGLKWQHSAWTLFISVGSDVSRHLMPGTCTIRIHKEKKNKQAKQNILLGWPYEEPQGKGEDYFRWTEKNRKASGNCYLYFPSTNCMTSKKLIQYIDQPTSQQIFITKVNWGANNIVLQQRFYLRGKQSMFIL